eukprot:TRINITY_DN5579_c0_g2_i1.p1 TRINITY_DN5579_c0_g2~~TRINITY_DN5579_c0_g2_i1.p1  ORF type:complete len:474 (-),score=123.55 TRINITY_DN5579_c0_g2_i1:705-2126(-)
MAEQDNSSQLKSPAVTFQDSAHCHPIQWRPSSFVSTLGKYFNPTQVCYFVDGAECVWNSNQHRLGRFSVLHLHPKVHGEFEVPPLRLWGFEWGNISWWVTQLFLWGCALWVVTSHYTWTERDSNTGPWAALAGIIMFDIGALLAVLQAKNAEKHIPTTGYDERALRAKALATGDVAADDLKLKYGGFASTRSMGSVYNLKSGVMASHGGEEEEEEAAPATTTPRALESGGKGNHECVPVGGVCSVCILAPHRRASILQRARAARREAKLPQGVAAAAAARAAPNTNPADEPSYSGDAPVEPWSWSPLPRPGLWKDPGYVAAVLLLVGSLLYTWVVVAGLPGVLPDKTKDNYGLWYGVSSTPELVGSVCFVASSWILMVEVQDTRWAPKPASLGWHVTFWNLIGGLGFLVSAAFTYAAEPVACCQKYGTALALYVGSVAFLLGTYLQLVEVLNPHRPPARARLTWRNLTNARFW